METQENFLKLVHLRKIKIKIFSNHGGQISVFLAILRKKGIKIFSNHGRQISVFLAIWGR